MDRAEFEKLRDMTDKHIHSDILLKPKSKLSPVYASGPIQINDGAGTSLALMYIEFNAQIDSKTINVMAAGVGPICRLEVDARVHQQVGRSHKHALQTRDCPLKNLNRDVSARPDLAGRPMESVFAEFCRMAHIQHHGKIELADT